MYGSNICRLTCPSSSPALWCAAVERGGGLCRLRTRSRFLTFSMTAGLPEAMSLIFGLGGGASFEVLPRARTRILAPWPPDNADRRAQGRAPPSPADVSPATPPRVVVCYLLLKRGARERAKIAKQVQTKEMGLLLLSNIVMLSAVVPVAGKPG